MQVSGIGGGLDPHSHSHTVSHCVHGDDGLKEKTGSLASFTAAKQQTPQTVASAQEESFSFFDWVGSQWREVRQQIGRFFGGRGGGQNASINAASERQNASINAGGERQMAEFAAQNTMPYPMLPVSENERGSLTLMQKLKYRVRALTDRLVGRFAQADTKEFHARDDRRDKMQQRRKYEQSGVKIEHEPPLDSHLLDSYDKKGAYSKLSTKR